MLLPKLNFYIGAQAAAEGRPSAYPDVNFCTDQDVICSDESTELRYVAGLFEWIERVQDYYDSTLDWSYKDELYKFVDEGMNNDAFVDAVSNIVVRGCHLSDRQPCSASTHAAVDTKRFLYGRERRINFKNILRLVFELPAAETPQSEINDIVIVPVTMRPTFSPTFKPTPSPVKYTGKLPGPAGMPASTPDSMPASTPTSRPTGAPVELSDLTQFNNGASFTINGEVTDESILLSQNTTLVLERGGYIEAPSNTDWPAVRQVMDVIFLFRQCPDGVKIGTLIIILPSPFRISTKSTFIGKGGTLMGSYADLSLLEGECIDGGDAIHVLNGQSSPETASRAEFYDDVTVIGGDAPGGIGGTTEEGSTPPYRLSFLLISPY